MLYINDENLIPTTVLRDAITGVTPSYAAMEHQIVKNYGDYTGGFCDKWTWNTHKLKTCSRDTLIELYNTIKRN